MVVSRRLSGSAITTESLVVQPQPRQKSRLETAANLDIKKFNCQLRRSGPLQGRGEIFALTFGSGKDSFRLRAG